MSESSNGVRKDIGHDLRTLGKLIQNPDAPITLGWPSDINGYIVNDELGSGGQGVALLAYDPRLSRQVVLKIYFGLTSDEARASILEEGRKLARVDSPYVIRCHSAEEFEGSPMLVLEHVKGVSLNDQRPVSSAIPHIMKCLAAGLHAIHDAGLSHGDIKPSNIIVDDSGTPRFIDFGLATDLGDESRDRRSSAAFSAPERANGHACDRSAADIFSLGSVLYFLLTGRPPFEGATADSTRQLVAANKPAAVRELSPKVSPLLIAVCERCMHMEPSQRFATAGDLLKTLSPDGRAHTVKLIVVAAAIFSFAAITTALTFLHKPTVATNQSGPIETGGQTKSTADDTEASTRTSVVFDDRQLKATNSIEAAAAISRTFSTTNDGDLKLGVEYRQGSDNFLPVDPADTLALDTRACFFQISADREVFLVPISVDYNDGLDWEAIVSSPMAIKAGGAPVQIGGVNGLSVSFTNGQTECIVVLASTDRSDLMPFCEQASTADRGEQLTRGLRRGRAGMCSTLQLNYRVQPPSKSDSKPR